MALLFSKYARGSNRVPAPQTAGEIVAHRFQIPVSAAQLVADNIIDAVPIPPDCRVLDMILDSTDLDSDGTPAVALDVGLMSGKSGEDLDDAGNARTIGAEFFSGSTVGQAGTAARPTLASAFQTAAVAYWRSIGIKVAVAPDVAVAGTIGLTVYFGHGGA